jgi:YbbR domain-containing protein
MKLKRSDLIPNFIKNISLGRFIISLGLALIVWGYVTATQYPEKTLSPLELPLAEPTPPPSDLEQVPSVQPDTVRVTISGPADQVSVIQYSQIKPYLDLSELKQPGQHDVVVKLKPGSLPSGVNVKIEPKTISIVLEKKISKVFSVEIIRDGEVNPDYYLDGDIPPPSPAQVTVTGRESLVNTVAKAQVRIDLTGRVGSLRTAAKVQLVDARDQRVSETDLTINPSTVNVTVNISYKLTTRTVPIRVVTTGEPSNGYIAGTAQANPTLVTVTSADKEVLDRIAYVETEPVDISGATNEVTKTVELKRLLNATIQGNTLVTVKIGIVPFQTSKTIAVILDHRNEASNLRYSYSTYSANLTISGPFQAFQPDLPLDQIKAYVDLQGRSIGAFELPVQVELPPNLVVTNNPTINVTISRPLPTFTPAPPTITTTTPSVTLPASSPRATTPSSTSNNNAAPNTTPPIVGPTSTPAPTPAAVITTPAATIQSKIDPHSTPGTSATSETTDSGIAMQGDSETFQIELLKWRMSHSTYVNPTE